ncbi:hypothetical protein Sjap_023623 [Stephania japonica]|uniref:Protein farnesyltransferase subunit beta n=1 Tax=Stephania japonica TaxID=461633 RepID=A0AAP0EBX7_9MAGN
MESPSPMTSSATITQRDQLMVEMKVAEIYHLFASLPHHAQTLMLELQRDNHVEFLTKGLKQLGPNYGVLDANRPWLCYWILHSIALLGDFIDCKLENDTVDFLNRCQLPHLATTYAAVNSLITLGGERALSSINREKLHGFLLRMKDPSGGFRTKIRRSSAIEVDLTWVLNRRTSYVKINVVVSDYSYMPKIAEAARVVWLFLLCSMSLADLSLHLVLRSWLGLYLCLPQLPTISFPCGEMDVRACYTAISVASVLDILDYELVQNVGNYILSCQTYEGGIAGEPGSEAHGGYTFCGLATMILINEVERLDLPSLLEWVVFRQGVECGFQGRINKLVDGCYSFWQGGACALMQRLHSVVVGQLHAKVKKTVENTDSIQTPNLSDLENVPGASSTGSGGMPITDSVLKLSDIGFSFIKEQIELDPLFHSIALQQYILLCSQVQDGGFRDKPGKQRDHYHTCYCLSGLSVSQHCWSKDVDCSPLPKAIFGPYSNLLERTHPLFNIVLDRYHEAHDFFSGQ